MRSRNALQKRYSGTALLLFRIQLDNQMLCDLIIQIITLERARYFCGLLFLIDFKPHGCESVACDLRYLLKLLALLALLAKSNRVANFYSVRGDINSLAVHTEMTVSYKLTCLAACCRHTHSEYDVVKSAFKKSYQVLTGDTFFLGSQLVIVIKLLFKNAIDKFQLLLFFQLQAVLGLFLAAISLGVLSLDTFFSE